MAAKAGRSTSCVRVTPSMSWTNLLAPGRPINLKWVRNHETPWNGFNNGSRRRSVRTCGHKRSSTRSGQELVSRVILSLTNSSLRTIRPSSSFPRQQELNRDAGAALLDRIGPAILLTHSQSGTFGWLVADARPSLVKAIVAMEPSGPPVHDNVEKGAPGWFEDGPFSKPYGLTAPPLAYDPPVGNPAELKFVRQEKPDASDLVRCWAQAEPARTLVNLQNIPVLVVQAEASYHAAYDHCTVAYLRQARVSTVRFIRLADVGIKGNGHMLMLEKNNLEIAAVAERWLRESVETRSDESTQRIASRVLLVLGLAVLLNYVDRANLAIAAPLLQDELSLSGAQIGVLLSSFFWVYAPAQVLAGWLVHRFDVRIVLAAGVALWSAATAMTGLAGGFASILLWRLVLGLGESVTFPSWQLILARHTAEDERGRANGFVGAGQGVGPMLGTLFGGLAMAHFGWRAMFIGLGIITLLWLWPWFLVTRSGDFDAPAEQDAPPVSYAGDPASARVLGCRTRPFLHQLRVLLRHDVAADVPREGGRVHACRRWPGLARPSTAPTPSRRRSRVRVRSLDPPRRSRDARPQDVCADERAWRGGHDRVQCLRGAARRGVAARRGRRVLRPFDTDDVLPSAGRSPVRAPRAAGPAHRTWPARWRESSRRS